MNIYECVEIHSVHLKQNLYDDMIKAYVFIFSKQNKTGLFSQYCIHLNNLVPLREKLKKIKLIKFTCLETVRVFLKIKKIKKASLSF